MDNEKLNPEEELQAENEIEALKQEMEFGAEMFIDDDAPPEIIKMFLENVRNYEEGFREGKLTTLCKFLGEPQFKNIEDIPNEEVENEISNLLQILEEKNISIDRPPHLTPKGYYHFLVTDFMKVEMYDNTAPGMIHGFIYDEIRHDGKYYIESHSQEAVEDILDLNKPYEGIWLTDECRSDKEMVNKGVVMEKVNLMRSQYLEIVPIAYGPGDIIHESGFMYATFGVHWEGILYNGEKESHEGMGICQLIFEDGEWMVQGIEMPGFKF